MPTDDRLPRTDLSGYFAAISQRLELQSRIMTPIIVHSGEMGDNDHSAFAELLRQYLPHRVSVDTRFVVNSKSDQKSTMHFKAGEPRYDDQSIGPQSDILLLDVLNNAPLCNEATFRVCPVEMVLGVIEVTRFLNSEKLAKDLSKLARVRELASVKCYKSKANTNRPGAYIVGFGGSLSADEMEKQVSALDDDLRPNAILILNKVLYVRQPYTVKFTRYDSDVLFHFISILRSRIESFPVGSVDLSKYLPAQAWTVWREGKTMSSSSASLNDCLDSSTGSEEDAD